ncbi:MAG TPA: N-6 DNA methylase [Terriglobia bacterium]|nr:N-6 DNA methylase [Terriglobia bacterium]
MTDLRQSLATLALQAPSIKQEATLRQYFIQALDDFVRGADLFSVNQGPLFQLEESIIKGRSDARLGALTFEVKLPRPTGKGVDAATKQVRGYIDEYRERYIHVRGVAYDGTSIALLDEQKEIVFEGPVQNGATLLSSWLTSLAPAAKTPEDMVNRFGSASALSQNTIKTLYDLFARFELQIPFIEEVFTIWKAVYGCAANINKDTIQGLRRSAKGLGIVIKSKKDAEKFVFALETYLSILLKLLVARVAVEQRLVSQDSVSGLICEPRGTEHLRYADLASFIPHLANVFEEDPFDWFIDAARAQRGAETSVRDILRCIVETIDNVHLVKMGQDFLQIFYQHFFDAASRRALGEFYTNSVLVRETLDAIAYDGEADKPIIDFCCGSGNFLVEILKRVRSKGKKRRPSLLLAEIEQNVVGVDIHPLAVAMARVNVIIAVAPLLERGRKFRVPIYWADSLVRLSVKGKGRNLGAFGEPVKISIPGMTAFNLPEPERFDWEKLFDFCRQHISRVPGTAEFSRVWQRFEEQYAPEEILPFEDVLKSFIQGLVDRHNSGRDTRWLPMLRNILFVERHKGRFQYVVGNPPWVRIHNIDEELRKRINDDYAYCAKAGWKRGCDLAGIGRGFARQTDLCVPFVERAFELLAPGGFFSFVITSKVQQALYANALRRDLVTKRTLIRISDYSLYPLPLFEGAVNYPLVLSARNQEPAPGSTCRVRVTNSQQQRLDFDVPQKELSLLQDDPESPWLMAPLGAVAALRKMQANGKMLGEDEATRPRMGVKTSANDIFVVTASESTDSAAEAMITTEGGETLRLERSLLRPLIRGRDLRAWGYSISDAIIWTHHDEDGEVLSSLPKRAEQYFLRHSKDLQARDDFKNGMPIWTLFRVSREKLGLKVAWKKYGTEMQSCMVEKEHSLGKTGKRLLVPLQTAYFIPIEARDKGLLLAGVFNSIPFKTLMMSFATRARGAYFHYISWIVGLGVLPVTQAIIKESWRNHNGKSATPEAIQRITQLSGQLHSHLDDATRSRYQSLLEQAVAEAFHLTEDEMQTLTDYYIFMRPPQEATESLDLESGDAEDL